MDYESLLMLDGEPLAQQKYWISHEIGDKGIPRLHACIHATDARLTQSFTQGQRLQQEDTLILGRGLWSIRISWRALFFNIYKNLPILHLLTSKMTFWRMPWCAIL
jgi:hypothetical protein